jgi:hypothetical protein
MDGSQTRSGIPTHIRGFIHVVCPIDDAGHDPEVLDCAAFEHPARMKLALEALVRHILPLMHHVEIRASHQPAVGILAFRDPGRAAGRYQSRFEARRLRLRHWSSDHREVGGTIPFSRA